MAKRQPHYEMFFLFIQTNTYLIIKIISHHAISLNDHELIFYFQLLHISETHFKAENCLFTRITRHLIILVLRIIILLRQERPYTSKLQNSFLSV